MSRTFVVTLALVLWPTAAGAADNSGSSTRWDPGERTTSHLEDEPRRRDADSTADGAYGRFDGLFDVGINGGAEFDRNGPAAAAVASIHYFSTAGLYASYADPFGGTFSGSSRVISLGVDLRPAFIPRWSYDLEAGSALLDLTIDSISLALGGYVREPKGGSFADARGLELSFGFGVPLLARAAGPWLGARCLLRWDDPWGRDAEAAHVSGLLTFGWHFMLGP